MEPDQLRLRALRRRPVLRFRFDAGSRSGRAPLSGAVAGLSSTIEALGVGDRLSSRAACSLGATGVCWGRAGASRTICSKSRCWLRSANSKTSPSSSHSALTSIGLGGPATRGGGAFFGAAHRI